MHTINDVVISERPREVILFLVSNNKSMSYPMLDRLYCRNGWANISNNLELLKLYDSMIAEGVIENTSGGFRKGPNWTAPEFLKQKKYTFNQA